MKRLAVLLALVMTVGLVGCGNSDTPVSYTHLQWHMMRYACMSLL